MPSSCDVKKQLWIILTAQKRPLYPSSTCLVGPTLVGNKEGSLSYNGRVCLWTIVESDHSFPLSVPSSCLVGVVYPTEKCFFFNQSHRHINISKQVAKLPHMTSIISSACLRPALRFLFSLSIICFARHRSLSICNTDALCYRFINRLPIVALTSKWE